MHPISSISRNLQEIVSRAKRHLEGAFKKFVKTSVYSNLQQAQLGGLPGTYHLVKSFLNVKIPAGANPGLEDGLVDGVPVWAMIYYSLRAGDVAAALQAAEQAGQGLAEVRVDSNSFGGSRGIVQFCH